MKWLATLLIVTQLCSQAVSIAKNQEEPAAPAAAVATQSPAPTPEPTPEPTPAATPTPTEKPAATPEKKKETPKQESNTPQASAQHTTRKGVSYTDEDVEELARIIFWEAGSESERGQMAVAEVILNRVQHDAWPHTIQGVIYQSSQFTPTEDPAYKTRPIDDRFYTIATRVLEGESVLCCDSVTYFSRGKSDYMADPFKIGRHWFGHYKQCTK